MKSSATALIIFLFLANAHAQELYVKTFGNKKDKAVLFLHGGPGYNSSTFEVTTAKNLAEEGFYVIVYDRRGEGRSADDSAKFTFKETFDDLNMILAKLEVNKANLVGHSFGGVVALLYAEKYPDKVNSIVLTSAPLVLQETFKTIIRKSKDIYKAKKDDENLDYIAVLEGMDSTTLDYSSFCFRHAMQNSFYSPKSMSEDAQKMYFRFSMDTVIREYGMQMTEKAPEGFWKNEKYTTLNLTPNLKGLLAKNMKVYALFGKDDGLFSKEQVEGLQTLIGKSNLKYLNDCSHNVFIDQQVEFVWALRKWLK